MNDSSIPRDDDGMGWAEQVDPRDPLLQELEALARMNDQREQRLRDLWNVAIPGLDVLYLKCCLDHLIGSYDLPKVRLLFQRQKSEILDAAESPEAEADFARQQAQQVAMLEAQGKGQLLDHLGRGGARRR